MTDDTDNKKPEATPQQGGPTEAALLAQLIAQYRVVDHLGRVIAELAREHILMLSHPEYEPSESRMKLQGHISAAWMEQLADMLNGVDACDEESDKWTDPIFERAHRLFPVSR